MARLKDTMGSRQARPSPPLPALPAREPVPDLIREPTPVAEETPLFDRIDETSPPPTPYWAERSSSPQYPLFPRGSANPPTEPYVSPPAPAEDPRVPAIRRMLFSVLDSSPSRVAVDYLIAMLEEGTLNSDQLIDFLERLVTPTQVDDFYVTSEQEVPVDSTIKPFKVFLPAGADHGTHAKLVDRTGATRVNPVTLVPPPGDAVKGNPLGYDLDDGTTLEVYRDAATADWVEDEPAQFGSMPLGLAEETARATAAEQANAAAVVTERQRATAAEQANAAAVVTEQQRAAAAEQANASAVAAEVARSTGVDSTQSAQVAAAGKYYPTTAAAQADAALLAGAVYNVPNTSTGQVDLYTKVSGSSSTFLMSLPGSLAVAANTAAINVANETKSTTVFVTEPPAASDPWVDVWSTITSPATRWTTSVVGGALQITQTQASILLRGLCRKDQQVIPGLWVYGEMVPATVGVQTSIGILIAPDNLGGGTLDATHGYVVTWRADGANVVYRGDGFTTSGIVVPSGLPTSTFTAGQTVGLGLLFDQDDASKCQVIRTLNGTLVGVYSLTGMPTSGYVGAVAKNTGNPITATIKNLVFHPTVSKARSVYVNGTSPPGGNGTLGAPFQTIGDGLLGVVDKPGETLRMYLKAGLYRPTKALSIPNHLYRNVEIIGSANDLVDIRGSVPMAAGAGLWTRPAGATNVWQCAISPGINASFVSMGQTLDLGTYDSTYRLNNAGDGTVVVSSAYRGGVVMPNAVYQSLVNVGGAGGGLPTVATQRALLENLPFSQFSDPSTALAYINPGPGVDPNATAWERRELGNILIFPWTAQANPNYCSIRLINFSAGGAYSVNITAQHANVHAENVRTYWSGNGFDFDACSGEAVACYAHDLFNDAYHSDAVSAPAVQQKQEFNFIECRAERTLVGDLWSNHELTTHNLIACRGRGGGKAAAAQVDETHMSGCRFSNMAQAMIYGIAGTTLQPPGLTVEVVNSWFDTAPNLMVMGDNVSAAEYRKGIVRGGGMKNILSSPLVIDASNIAPTSSILCSYVEDMGGNTDDDRTGTGGGTISYEGRPGHWGIARTGTAAQIASLADKRNQWGKGAGRQVWDVTNSRLMVATGPLPGDPWKNDGGGVTVTPA